MGLRGAVGCCHPAGCHPQRTPRGHPAPGATVLLHGDIPRGTQLPPCCFWVRMQRGGKRFFLVLRDKTCCCGMPGCSSNFSGSPFPLHEIRLAQNSGEMAKSIRRCSAPAHHSGEAQPAELRHLSPVRGGRQKEPATAARLKPPIPFQTRVPKPGAGRGRPRSSAAPGARSPRAASRLPGSQNVPRGKEQSPAQLHSRAAGCHTAASPSTRAGNLSFPGYGWKWCDCCCSICLLPCPRCCNGAGTGWILSRAAKPQDPSQSMGSRQLHFSIQQQMEADAQFLRWWKS